MSGDGYIPDRGDFLWLLFGKGPESGDVYGHEQQGHRPALCVSPYQFNAARGLAIVCPVSSVVKDYPTLVRVPAGALPVDSVIMVDQIRSVDWRARKGFGAGRCPATATSAVLAKLAALVG